MNEYLVLLFWVPVVCYQFANIDSKKQKQKWMLTGIAFGAVIAPISLGLVSWIYSTGILKVVGVVGLVLNIIHGPLGYMMATFAGFIDAGVALSASKLVIINVLNAFVWGSFYGSVGYNIDLKIASEGETEQMPEGIPVRVSHA